MTDIMLTPLSDDELAQLEQYEEVVERGLRTFVEVGTALGALRDAKLYRQTHGTFEAYCQDRFGYNDRRARQMIDAAASVKALEEIGTTVPVSERQARELSGLAPEVAAEVMTAAADTGKVTAASIAEAREQIAPKPSRFTKVASEVLVDRETGEVVADALGGTDPIEDPRSSSTTTSMTPSPVDDYLDSQTDLQDKNYISRFSAAMTRADDLLTFDAQRVAELVSDRHLTSLDHLVDSVTSFRDRVRSARPGLRLVNGGSK